MVFSQSFVQQMFLKSLICAGAGNLAVNKAQENACPYEVYVLVGEVVLCVCLVQRRENKAGKGKE